MTMAATIEQCPGCSRAEARAKMRRGVTVRCAWPGCTAEYYADPIGRKQPREPLPPQRVPPPTATLAPAPDRNRRNRMRTWNLIADMSLLAKHFAAIEGRAIDPEPTVRGSKADADVDTARAGRHERDRAAAVLVHQRWRALPTHHRQAIYFALIQRDGSELADADAKLDGESEARYRARIQVRNLAFERLGYAMASSERRRHWSDTDSNGKKKPRVSRDEIAKAKRVAGRAAFAAARSAYEFAAPESPEPVSFVGH